MTTAEDFLVDAEPRIAFVRDYLIAITGALSSGNAFDERAASALFRLADAALDEIGTLEREFQKAFSEPFPSKQPR
ncbi:hypothetical protein SAMN05428969_2849 [Devosia sp. YR412]|uniref:hypothetical protein n=1 Tax=Devosia sp. YR412 TaxID=1881030 RepID=UPI0008D47616|nr:hypothetical protein [Devosia sp. YR412]SEQ38299.1 hypothetical protein SAMN05428969_2849 [Devosia sp. YR412]